MNERFFELPEEKRFRIINAGFEVFAQNDYKRASTDEIARKGGISKGLLFYYFHNKRALYLFLFEEATRLVAEHVVDSAFDAITDFFELFEYAAQRKREMLNDTPYVSDFLTKAFFSHKEDVSDELNGRVLETLSTLYGDYFTHIDLSKFRQDVDPVEILQMLAWMSDGYVHGRERQGQSIDMDAFMERYKRWSALFKRIAYKEEYL